VRIFDARRKPIPLTLPEPLPKPQDSDIHVMSRHGIKLDQWWDMTEQQRRDARLSVAHAQPRST